MYWSHIYFQFFLLILSTRSSIYLPIDINPHITTLPDAVCVLHALLYDEHREPASHRGVPCFTFSWALYNTRNPARNVTIVIAYIVCYVWIHTHTSRSSSMTVCARAHNDDRGSLVGLRTLTKTGFARWNNMCGVYTIYVLSVRALLRQYTGKKCIYLSECVLAPTQDLPCRCLSARGTCERCAVGVEHAKHTSTHAYARVYTPLHILSADPSEARRTASRALSIRAPKSFGPHGGESSHMPAIIIHGLGSQNVEGILWNELLRIDRNCGTIGL